MRLGRRGRPGAEVPIVEDGSGRVFDLRPVSDDIDGTFLDADGLARVAGALAAGSLEEIDTSGWRVGAPIARPTAVICVGMNYAAHAAESGSAPPAHPVVFFKHPNTIVGPQDDVVKPPGADRLDWEVELAVVIGRRAHLLASPDEALDHVAGYTIANDVSERYFQIDVSGGQWSKGKCAPTFNPLGPWLVPATEVDGGDLRLWSRVNGEPRQDSSTADMIFDVPFIIWHLSQYMALEPGDVVNTGTPEGVALSGRFPYLQQGDVVELGITGLGEQRQEIVAQS